MNPLERISFPKKKCQKLRKVESWPKKKWILIDFGCFSLETKSRSFHQILNSACLEPSMDLVPTAEAKAELEKKAELDSIVSCKKEACSFLTCTTPVAYISAFDSRADVTHQSQQAK